jgi:hypothetical protein
MAIQTHGTGSPVRGYLFRVGEVRALAHTITADEPFTIDSVTATVYDAAGTTVVDAASGTITAVAGNEYQISYLLDTSDLEAGEYVYQLRYVVDGESLLVPGQVTLLPLTSKYDPYQNRVRGWLAEAKVTEPQRQLDYLDLMQALQAAVSRYEQDQPRRVLQTVTLSGGFEYDLPEDWVAGLSAFQALEYPVDATDQLRDYLEPHEWEVDELRSKWRFTYQVPSAGEVTRIVYTTRHTLSHTADTLPAKHFEAICQYAAGQALLTLANKAAQTSGPGLAAEAVNFRSKQQEFSAQAKELLRRAEGSWGRLDLGQVWTTWRYFPDHGRW